MPIHFRQCVLTATVLLLSLPATWAQGDSEGRQNLAADSTLPRGDGLAARFISDVGIANHPNVVFAEDFETPGDRERWGEITDRWTKQAVNRVWFDNVVIAHDYIGPSGKAKTASP